MCILHILRYNKSTFLLCFVLFEKFSFIPLIFALFVLFEVRKKVVNDKVENFIKNSRTIITRPGVYISG